MRYSETPFPDLFNAPDFESMSKQLGDWATKALQEAIAGSMTQILNLVFTGVLILIGIWIVVSVTKVFYKRFNESMRRKQIDALNKARIAERGDLAKVHVLRHEDISIDRNVANQKFYSHSKETDAAISKYLSPRSLDEMMAPTRVGTKMGQTKELFATLDNRAKASLQNTLPWKDIEKTINAKGSRKDLEESLNRIFSGHENWTEQDKVLAQQVMDNVKSASSRQDTLNKVKQLQRSTTQQIRKNVTSEVQNLYQDYNNDLLNIWLPENTQDGSKPNAGSGPRDVKNTAESLYGDFLKSEYGK